MYEGGFRPEGGVGAFNILTCRYLVSDELVICFINVSPSKILPAATTAVLGALVTTNIKSIASTAATFIFAIKSYNYASLGDREQTRPDKETDIN